MGEQQCQYGQQVKSSQVKSKNIILNLITLVLFATSLLAQAAVSLSVRHDFTTSVTPSDASGATGPNGSLVQGRDGVLYGTTFTNSRGAITSSGTIFRVSPDGTTFTHLHTFNNITEGRFPLSGLIQGSDGNFYGTTASTIYKMTTNGTEPGTTITKLHDFKGGLTDGSGILSAPVQGRDGNLYGTTVQGGQFGWGTVYKLNPITKDYSIIHHFKGAFTEGGNPWSAPLIVGKDGRLYGTTSNGGGNQAGTVFSINPAAPAPAYGFKTYNFPGGLGNLKSPRSPLMQGTDGFFYGTTGVNTGLYLHGTIYKFSAAGAGTFTPLHDFGKVNTFTSEGINPTAGLVQGSDGKLYGVTFSGGTTDFSSVGCGVIFSVTLPLAVYSPIHTLDGKTEGCNTVQNLTLHTNGKLYGVASAGRNTIPLAGSGDIYELNLGTRPFIYPTVDTTKAGVKIGIFGDFVGITNIKFNGINVSFDNISDTYIEVIVPFGAATGTIVVFKGTIQIKTLKVFLVQPVFTSFSPASGAVGNLVILTGKSLSQTTAVRFGGNKAAPFTVDSDSQLTVNVPVGAVTGKITIVTKGGSAVSATNFTVTP